MSVPQLIKQTAGCPVDDICGSSRLIQYHPVRNGLKGIVFDFCANKTGFAVGGSETSAHRLRQFQKNFDGSFPGDRICSQSGGVTDAFCLGGFGKYGGII